MFFLRHILQRQLSFASCDSHSLYCIFQQSLQSLTDDKMKSLNIVVAAFAGVTAARSVLTARQDVSGRWKAIKLSSSNR